MNNRDTGPRNLASLFSTMKNFVAAKSNGVSFSPGKSQNVPDKYCPVCATVFGLAPVEVPMTPKLCGICVDKLKAGQTALVCGNRYAFIEGSERLSDLKGRIVQIKPDEMDALEREYKGQVKTKDSNEKGQP